MLVFAMALSAFASSAWAQFGAPGGYVPYTVEAPAAAAAASARANDAAEDQRGAHCSLQSHGRNGDRYECDSDPGPAPRR
jgi:hypothetical protein